MITFSLLWCSGGANHSVADVTVEKKEDAVAHFRTRAPGLDDSGYQKLEGGSWIMAEEFSSLC